MCGITGVFSFSGNALKYYDAVRAAAEVMNHRGPDDTGYYMDTYAGLGHKRLSIIDTSKASAQPFVSPDGRYIMVYNGEFFNYAEYKDVLLKKGVTFQTTGDTEALLQMYIHYKESFLDKVDGFFSFAVYDKIENSLFMARDRYGIKPFFYCLTDDVFVFSSELKALFSYGIKKNIDLLSLAHYLQFNYIPAPYCILENVKKFPAGKFVKLYKGNKNFSPLSFSKPPYPPVNENRNIGYPEAKKIFYDLLNDSVKKRLIASVPLGSFLSGGIDSSAITALAARHKPDILSFSIGYKDEPMFDETSFAEMVSRKVGSRHHTFMLGNNDLYDELSNILDAQDEPFGDSSAIPMFILSKKTARYVKVALSGDGGDELLGGYNKHKAELILRQYPALRFIGVALPLLELLPQSRNNILANKIRQSIRFIKGAGKKREERYLQWASITGRQQTWNMLAQKENREWLNPDYRMLPYLGGLDNSFNSYLSADVKLVLQNDMLVKTDSMSMANSLEVRAPFLDFNLVEFLFTLPPVFKTEAGFQKKLLKESLAELLPREILTRKKQGFEVPLLKWFNTGLKEKIDTGWLGNKYVEEQGIFDVKSITKLKLRLFSSNPSESVARVWGLISFQHWYQRFIE